MDNYVYFCIMEKKIKILYIVTMAAIVGLLAVQALWLWQQYRASVQEQELDLFRQAGRLVETYDVVRSKSKKSPSPYLVNRSQMEVQFRKQSSQMVHSAQITIRHSTNDVGEILGYGRESYTDSVLDNARQLIHSMPIDTANCEVQRFVVPKAHIWENVNAAVEYVMLEHDVPFTTEGLDSVAESLGMDIGATLALADTMMWNAGHSLEGNFFRPVMKAVIPYSVLEKKVVEITCAIPMENVVKSMAFILTASAVVTILLIICLLWQILTIRWLLRLDAVRNSFVHTMIHELKRPVSTLKLTISSLANPKLAADEESRAEIIEASRAAVNNLSTYFARLRDIAFNEAAQIPLDLGSFDLHESVSSLIAKTAVPSGKRVEFINDVPEGLCIVADSLHMSQIISNLIENAIKYSGEDAVIRVGACPTDRGISITVADNGFGISESDRNRIFEKFYRSQGAVQSGAPGVGLGLAYVRLLVEAHGGDVSVGAADGGGSVFTINLPQE